MPNSHMSQREMRQRFENHAASERMRDERHLEVRDVMTVDPVTVTPEVSLRSLAQVLSDWSPWARLKRRRRRSRRASIRVR